MPTRQSVGRLRSQVMHLLLDRCAYLSVPLRKFTVDHMWLAECTAGGPETLL